VLHNWLDAGSGIPDLIRYRHDEHLSGLFLHSRETGCVTIRKKPSFRTNPALRDEIRNPEFANVNRPLLDPGSRPASRDLAGMTNYNTVSKAGIQEIFPCIAIKIAQFKNYIFSEFWS
jgi:hypothetical protein